MAITFTAKFLAELAEDKNTPDAIVAIELDSGTIKIGKHNHFPDVITALANPSSAQSKIDPEAGYATLGKFTFSIIGRDNFKDLVKNNYLKNRRVTKYEGFVATGFAFADYAATYTGIISHWTRNGDVLTVTVADDLQPTKKKFPVENATKTQYHDYSNTNPVDIKTNLILTQAPVPSARVNSAQFTSERDLWLAGWKFQRVLVKPEEIKKHLNELQIETNSFIVHDGEKITYKVFAPLLPGQNNVELRDAYEILEHSVSQDSGYLDHFYNRVVVLYDYDESGDDKEKNFDSVYFTSDADSEGAAQWDETTTKTIKSKWIKSHTFSQPSNVTGVVIYHVSKANGINAGKTGSTLSFNSANQTLSWTAPDGTVGDVVVVDHDGRYDIFDTDKSKYIRVVVTVASLPGGNQSDTITITALAGSNMVAALANKWINRYRDPVATIPLKIGLNHTSNGGDMWKPTDTFALTTDDACVFGKNTLAAEPMMLLSVRPDSEKNELSLNAIQTKIYKRYGFIGPSSMTSDYDAASDAEKEYAFIGDGTNTVGAAADDGYYIW